MTVMINEDYVSFETAKLLKEKGFDENTPVNYFVGDDKIRGCVVGEMVYHTREEEDTHLIACPTLQMAMKWLRETIGITIGILFKGDRIYYEINQNNEFVFGVDTPESYEKVCDEAIRHCLKILI